MAKDIKRHLSHLKNGTGAKPTSGASSELIFGEIAVGYKAGEEALYILDSNSGITEFNPTTTVLALAENYTDGKINALDAALTGTPGAGKTLTAFSQTDGKVSATFSNISITKSQVSDFAHNQASSTITAMTSYSKPSSTSAIATGDTLNAAIGKLEKALDGKSGTDNKTAQSSANTNGNFPILIKNSTGNTAETAATKFATGITINPSDNSITATNFKGKVNGITPTDNTGTVTSVQIGLPTGLSAATTAITSSGKFDIKYSNGYSIPTTAKQTNWDTAYSKVSGVTASTAAINSLTGSVGTMAFQNTSSYYTKSDLTGSSTSVVVAKAASATTAASAGSVAWGNVTSKPSVVTGSGLTANEIIIGNGGTGVTASSKSITNTAPSSSSNDATVPTSKAVWTAVSNGIATTDAMIYKSTIDGGSTGAYGALTPAANKGWTYKVKTAGKIDGVAVEVGDMLICNTDDTAAATSSNYTTIAANWDFIQTNIDGAVTGPTGSTNAHIAVFDGTTGKVIKDGTYTIGKSVPSNAVFTDTATTLSGHYAITATSDGTKSANASSTSELSWGSAVVTGVTLSGDAKGHITSVTVKSGKLKTPSKSDVGLGNVENKSSATIRGEITSSNVTTALGYTPISSVTTSSTNGNISVNGGNVLAYTHPTTSGNKHIPSAGSSGQFLGWDSDGTAKWVSNPNTHNSHALTITNGTAGAVSQGTEITYVESVSGCAATSGNLTGSTVRKKITVPANTDNYITGATVATAETKVDVSLSGNNSSAKAKASFTIPSATTSAAGVMTKADKVKLNGIATGAEVNQNAYSNIKVGSTTVAAASKTDTVEFSGGTAITIVGTNGTAGNDKITFDLGDVICGDYA